MILNSELCLTCAGAHTHDGVEAEVLLHVLPQVPQEVLSIGLHLADIMLLVRVLTSRWQRYSLSGRLEKR